MTNVRMVWAAVALSESLADAERAKASDSSFLSWIDCWGRPRGPHACVCNFMTSNSLHSTEVKYKYSCGGQGPRALSNRCQASKNSC